MNKKFVYQVGNNKKVTVMKEQRFFSPNSKCKVKWATCFGLNKPS